MIRWPVCTALLKEYWGEEGERTRLLPCEGQDTVKAQGDTFSEEGG